MARYTLLLADESGTTRRIVQRLFAGSDVDVVTVGDGDVAVARIPALRPHLVLADIALVNRSGYDVSAFVKGTTGLAHIRVLLLAGSRRDVDTARVEQSRCDGVVVKPLEPEALERRVRALLPSAAVLDAADDYFAGLEQALASFRPQPAGDSEPARSADPPPQRAASAVAVAIPAPPSSAPRPLMTPHGSDEELVARVTARVLERLGAMPGAPADSLVVKIVRETAERLVREELQRAMDNSGAL